MQLMQLTLNSAVPANAICLLAMPKVGALSPLLTWKESVVMHQLFPCHRSPHTKTIKDLINLNSKQVLHKCARAWVHTNACACVWEGADCLQPQVQEQCVALCPTWTIPSVKIPKHSRVPEAKPFGTAPQKLSKLTIGVGGGVEMDDDNKQSHRAEGAHSCGSFTKKDWDDSGWRVAAGAAFSSNLAESTPKSSQRAHTGRLMNQQHNSPLPLPSSRVWDYAK